MSSDSNSNLQTTHRPTYADAYKDGYVEGRDDERKVIQSAIDAACAERDERLRRGENQLHKANDEIKQLRNDCIELNERLRELREVLPQLAYITLGDEWHCWCGFCTTPTGTPPLSARRSLICATIDAVLAKKLP
jgi:glycine/D-amino acid oxidase-like deaminating enzyme